MMVDPSKPVVHPASYRDPSGYVFTYQGEIYRQVNQSFKAHFENFIQSGLYSELTGKKLLVPHEEIKRNFTGDTNWFTTLKPEKIPFISYPYEWSFSMLKDAALLTLQLALRTLQKGFILKDASPYNVQFYQGRMIFIDTLSFETYTEGEPWIAYRQFCESFLGPLSLMHYTGLPMQQLLLAHPNGVPLQYIKKLLPFKSKLNLHLYLHIHLHATYASQSLKQRKPVLSKQKLAHLLTGLQVLVSSLKFVKFENIWGNYYQHAKTRQGYINEKKEIIHGWFSLLPNIRTVVDVGGNTGEFSKLASHYADRVICADGEHFAIDHLYEEIKKGNETKLTPLCIDFTHPTPALGVNNEERDSFFHRACSDVSMGLALIHHLAIGKNLSFEQIATHFKKLGTFLIIEFVPKTDEKVKEMLDQKPDIYAGYSEASFETVFANFFSILDKKIIGSSGRTIYLMKKNA